MSLEQHILADLKEAMKSGNTVKRDTLRLLDSYIKNAEIEKGKREDGLSDEEIVEVVVRAVKQRTDSISKFEDGGRSDLAEKEKIEIGILSLYLPAQLSEEALESVVDEAIAEIGAKNPAETGMVMKTVMPKVKGKCDGNAVRAMIEKKLTNSTQQ